MSPGIGGAARGDFEQEREFAVDFGVVGEVVVDDDAVFAAVPEVLGDGGADVGGQVALGE
jgi:hypothetical protein